MSPLRKRTNGAASSGQSNIKPGRAALETKMRRRELNLLAISTFVSMISAVASSIAAWQSVEQLKASKEIFQEANTNQSFSSLMSSVHSFCQLADPASRILGIRPLDLNPGEGMPVLYSYSKQGPVDWHNQQSLESFSGLIFIPYENVLANLHSMRYHLSEPQYQSLGESVEPFFQSVLALRAEVNNSPTPRDAEHIVPLFIDIDYKCRVLRTFLPEWYVKRDTALTNISWRKIQFQFQPQSMGTAG